MAPYALPGGIPGGKAEAESKKPSDFSPTEVAAGRKVEEEHTTDSAKQTDIALDHLTEIPDYYRRLNQMEREAKEKSAAAADTFIRTKLREGERRQPPHYTQPAPYFTDPQVAEVKQAAYHQGIRAALYAVNLMLRS